MAATSASMDMMMSATSTMDMAMSASTSMDMDMSSATDSSMDMSHMAMLMNMYLTKAYKDYPVLFSTLLASNGGQAFGLFLLFFVVSFLSKGLEFLKNYLEQKVWNNPNYLVAQQTTIIENCDCDDTDKEGSAVGEASTPTGTHRHLSLANTLVRDVIRLGLCFVIELFGYAMMLVVMTMSLVYFFAVVTGMAVGRFFFERLSDAMGVRPGANNFLGHH